MNLKQHIANGIGVIFNPLLMPLYCTLIILYGNTVFRFLPSGIKPLIVLTVCFLTIVIPLISIFVLKWSGIIGDVTLSDRRDRIIPLFLTAFFYFVCMVIAGNFTGLTLARKLFLGTTVSMVIAAIITMRWKISIHALGTGGAVSLLYSLTLLGYGDLTGWIMIGFLCAGLTISSRLYLGKHTPLQVAAGFSLGFIAVFLFAFAL